MTDRRYTEDEMATIFAEATKIEETGRQPLARREGLTLVELQAIGTEAGIPARLVAEAALNLDRPAEPMTRTKFGLPIGVGRTVELGRKISDAEWERLVVDLRETFDARGAVSVEGSLRQWTNGNLQILVEPSDRGDRLRMRTTNANARDAVVSGLFLTALAAAMLAFGGSRLIADPGAFAALGFMAVGGIGVGAWGALRLPGWARTRQQQMTEIAARLLSG